MTTDSAEKVSVWTKGFRVSLDSEEFQRVIPISGHGLGGDLAVSIDQSVEWPAVLRQLYGLSQAAFRNEFCLRISSAEALVLCVARTEDRHRRPSVVAVAVSRGIDWRDPDLHRQVDLLHEHALQLADYLSAAFRRNPESVQTLLRSGEFELGVRQGVERIDALSCGEAIGAVREWRGISGLATPRLAVMGANVLVVTGTELPRRVDGIVDGIYDPATRRILPVGERLVRWSPAAVQPQPLATSVVAEEPREAGDADVHLREISRSLRRLADTAVGFGALLQELLDLFYGRRK